MRYLTENNTYAILYEKTRYGLFGYHTDLIEAFLIDKITNEKIFDQEKYLDDLEPCLMKLGRRLIKKWEKTKK